MELKVNPLELVIYSRTEGDGVFFALEKQGKFSDIVPCYSEIGLNVNALGYLLLKRLQLKRSFYCAIGKVYKMAEKSEDLLSGCLSRGELVIAPVANGIIYLNGIGYKIEPSIKFLEALSYATSCFPASQTDLNTKPSSSGLTNIYFEFKLEVDEI